MRPTDAELYRLAEQTGQLLQATGRVLVTAESCTGGWIGQVITAVPGSSAWYVGGFITYSNTAKQMQLGVLSDSLTTYGAVSEIVVKEMASGAMECSAANVALAVSGVAGPGGGTPDKPVGMVCLAWLMDDGTSMQTTSFFSGNRESVRAQAVAAALQGLIEMLNPNIHHFA